MLIDNLQLFLTIAEKGTLIAAARETGLSATTVSERLAALEEHYGVVLMNRTTRSISLTEEGRLLIDGSKSVLAEVEELDARIRHGVDALSGNIRLSAPVDLGRGIVSRAVSEFTNEHPAVSIELSLSDGFVDIVEQGFDIALRLGEIADSSMRIRRVGQVRRIVCASPAYLEAHGAPRHPQDLADHNCLIMRFGMTRDDEWRFNVEGKDFLVHVKGNRTVNDGSLVRGWALEGHGLIMKSEMDVGEDIKADRLVPLLEEFEAAPNPLQMLFPPGRARPKRVKAFADLLAQKISA